MKHDDGRSHRAVEEMAYFKTFGLHRKIDFGCNGNIRTRAIASAVLPEATRDELRQSKEAHRDDPRLGPARRV
jgi:hypothetical protein